MTAAEGRPVDAAWMTASSLKADEMWFWPERQLPSRQRMLACIAASGNAVAAALKVVANSTPTAQVCWPQSPATTIEQGVRCLGQSPTEIYAGQHQYTRPPRLARQQRATRSRAAHRRRCPQSLIATAVPILRAKSYNATAPTAMMVEPTMPPVRPGHRGSMGAIRSKSTATKPAKQKAANQAMADMAVKPIHRSRDFSCVL